MASATYAVTRPGVPKHIDVNGARIRFRFLQSVLWGLIVTSLAVAAVAALYYLATQLNGGLIIPKARWDHLFPYSWWPNYRHGIRDFGEPVLAAMAVHSLIAASWKKHPEQRLTGLMLAFRVVLALAAALGVIILGVYMIDYLFAANQVATTPGNSTLANILSGINWQAFAFSFIVVHLIRVLWTPVGNTISLEFTESAVRRARGTLPVWVRYPLAPPAMRERFAWVQDHTPQAELEAGRSIATRLVMVLVVLTVPLAGYGEYVLHVIAKGK